MSDTNEADLRGHIAHLERLNAGLANQVVRSAERLEESRRELLATGWDACAKLPSRPAMEDNPYRKPLDLPGGTE